MANRLWTHGYDVYTPTQAIVGHDYLHRLPSYAVQATTGVTNDVERMQWSHPRGDPDNPYFLYTRSRERFHRLLLGRPWPSEEEKDTTATTTSQAATATATAAALEALTQYQLGRQRTIQAFATFVGLDWWSDPARSVYDRCPFDAQWVPYATSSPSSMASSPSTGKEPDPWIDVGDLWSQDAERLPRTKQNLPVRGGGESSPRTAELSFHPVRRYTSLTPSPSPPSPSSVAAGGAAAREAIGRVADGGDGGRAGGRGEEAPSSSLSSSGQTLSQRVVAVVEYETGELWWMFQWLDRFIDVLIEDIDAQVRRVYQTAAASSSSSSSQSSSDGQSPPPPHEGHHGRHVIRVVLVVFPVMLGIVLVAVSLLLPPGARPSLMQQWWVGGGGDASGMASRAAMKRYVLPTSGDKHI